MNSCHSNFLGALKVRFEKVLSVIAVDIHLSETLLTMKVGVLIYDLCLLLTCWNLVAAKFVYCLNKTMQESFASYQISAFA